MAPALCVCRCTARWLSSILIIVIGKSYRSMSTEQLAERINHTIYVTRECSNYERRSGVPAAAVRLIRMSISRHS